MHLPVVETVKIENGINETVLKLEVVEIGSEINAKTGALVQVSFGD